MTATISSDSDRATAVVRETLTVVASFQSIEFWKMLPDDLLALGRDLKQLSRLVYAAQVHLTGEIETAGLAAAKSCSSTPALLRQAFNISPAEATGWVKAARQILPRALVGVDVDADPKFLERAATVILEHADPDGTLGPRPSRHPDGPGHRQPQHPHRTHSDQRSAR